MTAYGFTKLVVADLDAMFAFYTRVYGLEELGRVRAEIGGEPIEEIMLAKDGGHSGLILLTFPDRQAPVAGEVILGFTTSDLAALLEEVVAAGGAVHVPPFTSAEAGGLQVAFATDPEGHLTELVQLP